MPEKWIQEGNKNYSEREIDTLIFMMMAIMVMRMQMTVFMEIIMLIHHS